MVSLDALQGRLLAQPLGCVTLLSGAHGSGKTTQLTQLYHALATANESLYWLSLTPEDNQPDVLRSHLIQAFALSSVASDEGLPDLPCQSTMLIDGMEFLHNPMSRALLEWCMLSLPASSRIYASVTRVRGAALHNGRLRGVVEVIEPTALRMSDEQAQQLLPDYASHEVKYLNSLVDGWAAGLRFLQRNSASCQQLLSDRSAGVVLPLEMSEYLDVQFAEGLTEQSLSALMQLSVFGRFTPNLLVDMPDPPCTWQLIEDHMACDLMLDYMDAERRWVSFHPVFAWYLSHRLRRHNPRRYEQLKLFAVQWFLNAGQPSAAMQHAVGLNNSPVAARLIEEAGGISAQLADARHETLETLLAPTEAGEFPLLFFSQLYQRIRNGLYREARSILDQAWCATEGFSLIEAGSDPVLVQAWAHMMDLVLRVSADQADYQVCQAHLESAFQAYLGRDPVLVASIASVLGFCYVEQGDYAHALSVCRLGLQAGYQSQENSATLFVLLHQANAQLAMHSVAHAQTSTEQALSLAQAAGMSDSYEVLSAQIMHAAVLYESNLLDQAQALLSPALAKINTINGWMRLYMEAFSVAAALAGAQGNWAAVEQVIRAGLSFAGERQYERLTKLMRVIELRELCRAQQWSKAMLLLNEPLLQEVLHPEQRDLHQWPVQQAGLMVCAQMYLEIGRPHDCLAYLEQMQNLLPLSLDKRQQVEFDLLWMRASFALRRFNAAFESFNKALLLVNEAGLMRCAQQGSAHLLAVWSWARRQGRSLPNGLEPWLKSIFQTVPESAGSVGELPLRVETNFHLSPRETEIIGLVAQGYINKEIAAILGISEGTVKGHRKSVHEKLGVRSRSQAISRARELLLI